MEHHYECLLIIGTCARSEILLGGVGGLRVWLFLVAVLSSDDLVPLVFAMHGLLVDAGVKLVLFQLQRRLHILYVERP